MKDSYDIYYDNCPHFTVGRVDQWGEQGYLFYEGMVYDYYEDRKEQSGKTYNKQSINSFLEDEERNKIEVPDFFRKVLMDYLG